MNRELTLIGAFALAAPIALAGDLAPPPGPIDSTDRIRLDAQSITLPHVINEPGSYVLTSNFTGVAGQVGFSIEANDVTLDLNGFVLDGDDAGTIGIFADSGTENLRVVGGTLRGWAGTGIVAGLRASVSNVVVRESNMGFNLGENSIAVNCAAQLIGTTGIAVSSGSSVEGCAAHECDVYGIFSGGGAAVRGCSANLCGVAGIVVGEGATASDCAAFSNSGQGIVGFNGSTIVGCSASGNGNDGIRGGAAGQVRGCSASANTGDGIEVQNDCYVVGNTCDANGSAGDGAGIHATGNGNRIDGNTVTDNDRGIDVDAMENFIVRNSAEGNATNYDIVAGNSVGTIQTTPVGAGAWDNFDFDAP